MMWGFSSSGDIRVSWRSTTCGLSTSRRFFSSVSRAARLLQLNCEIVRCVVGRCRRRRPRRRRLSACRSPSGTGVLAVLAGGLVVGVCGGGDWVGASTAPPRGTSAGVLEFAGGRAPIGVCGGGDWVGASAAPPRGTSAGVLALLAGGRSPKGSCGGRVCWVRWFGHLHSSWFLAMLLSCE